MTDQKSSIRAEALRYRNMLAIHPDWAEQAAERFFEAVPIHPGQIVSLYYPRGKEMDTFPLAQGVWARGADCALPVMEAGERRLHFARWQKDTLLSPGAFGIPIPSEPDFIQPQIVVVPLLAFDQSGHRLGYGKGHYDATLEKLGKSILSVGLAYAEQACLFALPAEPHDRALDLVVTPQRVFDFRR